MPVARYVSHIPSAVDINSEYYGPQETTRAVGQKKEARTEYDYAFNETASLIDQVVYQTNIESLKKVMQSKPVILRRRVETIEKIRNDLKDNPVHRSKNSHNLTDEAVKRYVDDPKSFEAKNDKGTTYEVWLALTKEERDMWQDPQQLATKYVPAIQEHFQRRIDLFLMQLVSSFGTELHFEVGPTQHQAESSKSLFVEFEGHRQKVCKKGERNPTHNAKVDLLINHEDTSHHMRGIMLRLRSEAIKRNMRGQAELISKIDLLAKQILTEIKGAKGRTPAYYHEAFKLVLLDKASTDDRRRLTQLFALIDPQRVGTRKVGIDKTKEVIAAAAMIGRVDRIKELAKTLSADMRTMRTDEISHRGDAMRALRAGKKWTQVKLGEELRARYPRQPSSQPTVSRTERGERLMSETLAAQLSETFDVPKELLLPQVFFK